MKIYVVNTDDRWLRYHINHSKQSNLKEGNGNFINFWSVFNGSNYDVYNIFKKEKDQIIVVFRTTISNHHGKTGLIRNRLYGVGKIMKVDEPQRETRPLYNIKSLWNTYLTKNGCDKESELPILMKGKKLEHCCNILVNDYSFFDPIDIPWWVKKYRYCMKGKMFDVNPMKKIPSSVNDTSSDEDIGLWIYGQIKGYI